jgi:hypothetical protein
MCDGLYFDTEDGGAWCPRCGETVKTSSTTSIRIDTPKED